MIEEIITYKNILNSLKGLIDNSPYKKGYIIAQTGISAPTFYRKLKTHSFTPEEALAIARIISPEDAYLHDLKESIKKGKEDYKNNNTHNREEIINEIKDLVH